VNSVFPGGIIWPGTGEHQEFARTELVGVNVGVLPFQHGASIWPFVEERFMGGSEAGLERPVWRA
jgi:hypothetical protein